MLHMLPGSSLSHLCLSKNQVSSFFGFHLRLLCFKNTLMFVDLKDGLLLCVVFLGLGLFSTEPTQP